MAGRLSHPRLGLHIRTAAGLVTGARRALELGCSTFQIMSGNPSAWNPGTLDPVKAEAFRLFLDEHDLRPVFLHAGYLINLSCRRGRNAPLYAKSVKLLKSNLARAAALSCEYVVVHMGSRKGYGEEEARETLVDALCKLPGGPVLLLENGAGCGDSVGCRFDEIAAAIHEAEARGAAQPLGICLDTAHLWGAGHDLTSAAAVKRLISEFDSAIGLDYLRLIHLNDSPVEWGSRRDRHEHLGRGVIPLAALKAFVRHPQLRHVAMILETPGSTNPSDEQRMADLRELAGVHLKASRS